MEQFYHELIKKKIKDGKAKRVLNKEQYDKWIYKMIRDCIRNTGIHDGAIKDLASHPYVEQEKRMFWNMKVIYTNKRQRGNVLDHHQFMVYISEDGNYLRITNVINGKSGYSKKNTGDKFDAKIALAIAWARYCKNDIPICRTYITKEHLRNLSAGTVFYDTISGTKMKFVGTDPMNDINIIVWIIEDENRASLASIYPEDNKFSTKLNSLFTKEDDLE